MPPDDRAHPDRLASLRITMSTEQLTPTPATNAASAEKGLLIAVVLMVVLGVAAMLLMV
jgi:hypothetical protein